MACQAPLAEKVAWSQNCDYRFFAGSANRGNLHAALLYIQDALGGSALRKDNLCSLELSNFSRNVRRI